MAVCCRLHSTDHSLFYWLLIRLLKRLNSRTLGAAPLCFVKYYFSCMIFLSISGSVTCSKRQAVRRPGPCLVAVCLVLTENKKDHLFACGLYRKEYLQVLVHSHTVTLRLLCFSSKLSTPHQNFSYRSNSSGSPWVANWSNRLRL